MAAVAYLAAHPELPRPTLRVGFTPDEEIGEGATLFDVERFGARCAYTLDGSQPRRAAGRDVHRRRGRRSTVARRRRPPGLGDGEARQRRAARRPRPRRAAVGPADARRRPRAARASSTRTSSTATREPGDRPRDRPRLRRRRCSPRTSRCCARTAEEVVAAEPRARARRRRRARSTRTCAATSAEVPEVVEARRARDPRARASSRVREPIRGGTDGSMLSASGLPTPNIFTGGHEYHSVREWASRAGHGLGVGRRRAPGRGVGAAGVAPEW